MRTCLAAALYAVVPPATPGRAHSSASVRRWGGGLLVRIDQKLLTGRALAVGGDVLELERLRQRHHLGVVAGERRLQALDDALAQPLLVGPADLLQERRQQPSADAPRRAVVARQLDRPGVEAAVDIDLLVHARAVAVEGGRRLVDRRFHRREDL